MKITELLTEATVTMTVSGSGKTEAIGELAKLLDGAGKLADVQRFMEAVLRREDQGTTGIGDGIAIPHAKSSAVKEAAIAFGKSEKGVDFASISSS
ncbi:Phosphotransferase system mannitol/fructose-specific IIA domain (Ntr-type) [Caldibacillus debilis GB1]|jgi:PTS system fructose-specific IIC component|uniref:Phosphotransferase system mannitol/fructose-specific IIA domain (Ntr-type) n=1 Tax=Caldibacillus debilis GB1 TaxID=1339248 RepID=A0A420VBA2_9BACI|nr:Phosphotransferase system mannitol/fructose-specific IIA domain (Ntr-type) [Caldibacillus debilis GB1]